MSVLHNNINLLFLFFLAKLKSTSEFRFTDGCHVKVGKRLVQVAQLNSKRTAPPLLFRLDSCMLTQAVVSRAVAVLTDSFCILYSQAPNKTSLFYMLMSLK